MKQSCYFAKVCDREFNIKLIGVNLFLLPPCKVLCGKGTKFVLRYSGLLLKDSGAKASSFDESRKLCNKIRISHVLFNF